MPNEQMYEDLFKWVWGVIYKVSLYVVPYCIRMMATSKSILLPICCIRQVVSGIILSRMNFMDYIAFFSSILLISIFQERMEFILCRWCPKNKHNELVFVLGLLVIPVILICFSLSCLLMYRGEVLSEPSRSSRPVSRGHSLAEVSVIDCSDE